MSRFVLDSSVTMAWLFEDQKTSYTEAILDSLCKGGKAMVPPLWSYEVINVLIGAQRLKRITQAQSVSFFHKVHALPIATDGTMNASRFLDIMTLAHQYALTGYNAAYLELALREDMPLATLDDDLKKAARTAGVRLTI